MTRRNWNKRATPPAPLGWGAIVFLVSLTLFGLVSQLADLRRGLATRVAGRLIGPLSR
jgi:hypothetical protein